MPLEEFEEKLKNVGINEIKIIEKRDGFMVEVWLKGTSQPIKHNGVESVYEKGSYTCIYVRGENMVFKYPTKDVFRLVESYKNDY